MLPNISSPTSDYNRASSGSGQAGLLVRGDPTRSENIVARCSNINWRIGFNISDIPEINTRISKETAYGRQDLVTGQIGLVMTLANNDQLPTSRSIVDDDDELTLYIMSGDDNKLTTTKGRVISDVFIGVKISDKAGGVAVNQLRMTNVGWIARDHMNGAEWKLKNSAVPYPAVVSGGGLAPASSLLG
jgi:hypothetical protein